MDKNRLGKYLDGQGSPEERSAVEAWLADGRSDFSTLEEALDASWENTPAAVAGDAVLKQELLAALHRQLFNAPVIPLPKPYSPKRWFRLAAAVLLPLAIGLAWWQSGMFNENSDKPQIAWKTLSNNSDVQKMAVLPDNSHVWLNPGSQLNYTTDYVNGRRAVRLCGEAFFDVAQDAAHPFVVQAGSTLTQVLGTAFNIEAYPGEKHIRISLVSGRVAVQQDSAQQTATILKPGQLLVYNTASEVQKIQELKMKHYADWTGGNIVFSDVPVKDALNRVAARFHLTLNYHKGVDFKDKRFTSVFTKETPEEMLQLLLFVSDCHFTRNGNTVEVLP